MGEERKKKRESFPLTEDEGWSRTWATCLMAFSYLGRLEPIDDRSEQRRGVAAQVDDDGSV